MVFFTSVFIDVYKRSLFQLGLAQ